MNSRIPSLRARQRQHTRAEIVRVAFDLFARRGYEAVSADAIAEAAGISRATFFNYFPRKETILLELARARAGRLKALLTEFRASGRTASFDALLALMLKLTEENARISIDSKRLLLDTFIAHLSHGLLLPAREEAVQALAGIIRSIPGRRKAKADLIAATMFAVFVCTMLEWLMREGVPRRWLVDAMRSRLSVVLEGVA